MRHPSRFFLLLSLLFPVLQAEAQEDEPPAISSARWLFDTEFGSQVQLGQRLSSTSFGPSAELPLWSRYELQGNLLFSPTETVGASKGQSLALSGSGIGWVNSRIGVSVGFEHTWLWAPEFDNSGWSPLIGTVIRDHLYRSGRFYASYEFPTGCGAPSATSGCRSPSSRTQGFSLNQEFRLFPHFRSGLKTGLFHFCDNSLPSGARACHWSGAVSLALRFEFDARNSVGAY